MKNRCECGGLLDVTGECVRCGETITWQTEKMRRMLKARGEDEPLSDRPNH
jgi:hypothetical protein